MITEIKKAIIKLEKGVTTGWTLNLVDGDASLLKEYYLKDYLELSEDEKEFNHESSFEEAKKLLLDCSSENGVTIESIDAETFSISKVIKPNPIEEEVDLKWSLWQESEDEWEDYAPGVYQKLKDAFLGDGAEIRVHTAPRKEIRFGDVVISEGKAEVNFRAIWDSPSALVPDACPEFLRDEMEELITSYFSEKDGYYYDYEDPIGASVVQSLSAVSFDKLMGEIDDLENKLVSEEGENSELFDVWLKSTLIELTSN